VVARCRLLHGDQDKERTALETVEATGREAMAEMRKIVGLLRSGDEAPDLTPPPSLAHLHRLTDNFRQAGLAVEVEITAMPRRWHRACRRGCTASSRRA
jgi:signal transduction histidine kinase